MKQHDINIICEDSLHVAVIRRLIDIYNPSLRINVINKLGSRSEIEKRIVIYNGSPEDVSYFIMIDLDSDQCAPALINKLLPRGVNSNNIVRIAVRQIESWLLADSKNLSSYFGIKNSLIPNNTDMLSNSKNFLIEIAKQSNRSIIKCNIVPDSAGTAKQGPDYNYPLIIFILEKWDPNAGMIKSDSLKKAIDAVRRFKQSNTNH